MKGLFTTLATLLALSASVGTGASAAEPDHGRSLRADVQSQSEVSRELQSGGGLSVGTVKDGAIAVFTIAKALQPLLPGMFKKKECRQVACWVATRTETCGMTAANQVQRELMRGRNSFAVESVNSQGMWVRYWRTQFTPPDRGEIANGKCGGGTSFSVSNCQLAGKVYC